MSKKKEIVYRAYAGFFVVVCIGIAILGKAAYIQTAEGDHYRALAEKLTIFPKEIQAERGNIYSADGRLLATTLPVFELRVDFKTTYIHPEIYKQNIDSFALLMAAMFKDKTARQYKSEMQHARNKKRRYYLLRRNVSWAQLHEMRSWPLMRSGQYKSGVIAVQDDRRLLPFGSLAKRTIGYTNKSGVKVGLEGAFEQILRGERGVVMVQRIAGGATIPIDSRNDVNPKPGKDIFTTIDINLQDVAEDALRRALTHHQAEHGCVVLMEVKTGKVRAMANLKRTTDSSYEEAQNFAAGETTEPGSTFKAVTLAALIEDGFISNKTKVDLENGSKAFFNRVIKDHDRPDTNVITVQKAFETSSNVAMAKLANQYYYDRKKQFYDHLVRFGFSKPVEVGLPGAAQPTLHQPNKWSGVSVAYLAHGYEVRLTPLHVLQFYNAVANQGVMVAPTLIDKIYEYGKVVDSPGVKILDDQLLKEETVTQMREMMEGVVERGTAKNLYTDYLKIAGKTGTAVIAQGSAGYTRRVYQASFCGYFPADAPEYTMIVVINSPGTNGYYGNVVAGSIFREVADKVYSISLNMHRPVNAPGAIVALPTVRTDAWAAQKIYEGFDQKLKSGSADWVSVKANGKSLQVAQVRDESGLIPDLRGMALKDALFILENRGCKVQLQGKGIVRSQQPAAGNPLVKGQTVVITLGI